MKRKVRLALKSAFALTLVATVIPFAGGTGNQAVASTAPTFDKTLWDHLSALRSYHVDAFWKVSGTKQKTETVQWSEDVHGQDFHLTISSAGSSGQQSEFYVIGDHYYVGQGGHFTDIGDMGKQMITPLLQVTLGYWTGLVASADNVHYVGRTTYEGRAANRYTVSYDLGAAVTLSTASFSLKNSVILDKATQAPLQVLGSYSGSDGAKNSFVFNESFKVSKIGKVGSLQIPS